MTVALSTIGSQCVTIEVTPAALPGAEGGVTLWITHWKGTPLEERIAYTLTVDETKQLVCELARVLSSELLTPLELATALDRGGRGNL